MSQQCFEPLYNRGFDRKSQRTIKATVRLLSACRIHQQSFGDRKAGVCTRALLSTIFPDGMTPPQPLRWSQVIREMRAQIRTLNLPQVPQLTSSRYMEVSEEMHIVEPSAPQRGRKRAVLIGIKNYRLQNYEAVDGAHNDVRGMRQFLMNAHSFRDEDIKVLMDDEKHRAPVRDTILAEFRRVAMESRYGDSIVCHFSGHGEINRYDEPCILPKNAGDNEELWIPSEVLYNVLVNNLKEGVTMTFVMDCCHSGDMLNLPYQFLGDGTMETMKRNLPVLKKAAKGVSALSLTVAGIYGIGVCADCMEPCCSCWQE